MPPKPGLTCKLRARGAHQVEIKLHYPLRSRQRQIFETDVYVFAPDKLDLTADSYGVSRVLQEVVLLIRRSSPRIPLDALLRLDMPESPLARITAIHRAGQTTDRAAEVIRELKTLASAYRSESDATAGEALLAASAKVPDAAALRRPVSLLTGLPAAYRALRREIEGTLAPPALRDALAWADESLSILMERALYRVLDRVSGRRSLSALAGELKRALGAEAEYRQAAGMPLIPAPGATAGAQTQNERVLMRLRALKRWSQSDLYMRRKTHREGARVGEVVAGVAAALAMTVAVVAAAFAEKHFSTYSLPWAFIIVFAYILKDRLKDAARRVIGALIPRWLSDRSHRLMDPELGNAGLTRETVTFRAPESLPVEVREARRGAPAAVEALPGDVVTPEMVVHLRVWMRTRSARLLEDHQRLRRLTSIVRWGVDGWLEEMDAPYAALRMTVGGAEVRARARHVYTVHMIVRVREPAAGAVSVHLYRITLSREGIVRTEPIRLPGLGVTEPTPSPIRGARPSRSTSARRGRRRGWAT